MVSFRSEKFLVCFTPAVLIFFIAGLLYLLRFKRVDNLGAYRIPSETGLLIPSVYSYFRAALDPARVTERGLGSRCQCIPD